MNSQVHQNKKLCQCHEEVKQFKTGLNLKKQKRNSSSSNEVSSISSGSTGSPFPQGRGATCLGSDSEDLNEPQDCSEEGNQSEPIFPQLFVRQQTRLVKTSFKIAVSCCLMFILTLLKWLKSSFDVAGYQQQTFCFYLWNLWNKVLKIKILFRCSLNGKLFLN